MTLNTLKALYEYGKHHIQDYRSLKGHLLLLGKSPTILSAAFNGVAPLSNSRTSGVIPNIGYDSKKYVLIPDSKMFETFWDLQVKVFPTQAPLLDETREALLKRRLTGDLGSDGDWFILADPNGQPLIEDLKFKEWWANNVGAIQEDYNQWWCSVTGASETETGQECHCWVTGELCIPLRVHSKSSAVPKADSSSITSYQYPEYGLQGQIGKVLQGYNFPLSPKAGRAIVAGLQKALTIPLPDLKGKKDSDRIVLVIPSKEESPLLEKYLPLFHRYTKKEEADPLWKGLESETPSDDYVHIALLKGSKGRIAILEQLAVTEGFILQRLRSLRKMLTSANGNTLTLLQFIEMSNKGAPYIPPQYQRMAVWDFIVGNPLSPVIQTKLLQKNNFIPEYMAHTRKLLEG